MMRTKDAPSVEAAASPPAFHRYRPAERRSLSVRGRQFFVHDNASEWLNMVEAGQWEPLTFRVFDLFVEPDSVFVDVGAWLGITALYGATLAGEVHAFECDPSILDILEASISANPDLAPKMSLYKAALATFDGTVPIYNNFPGNSGTSIVDHFGYTPEGSQDNFAEAAAIDGARFLQTLDTSRISLIKLDIEGAEYELLPHIGPVLEKWRPSVHLSLHPGNIARPEDDASFRQMRVERTAAMLSCFRGYRYSHLEVGTDLQQLDADAGIERIIEHARDDMDHYEAVTFADRDVSQSL